MSNETHCMAVTLGVVWLINGGEGMVVAMNVRKKPIGLFIANCSSCATWFHPCNDENIMD